MSKRQESLNPAEKNPGGGIEKGEPRVLAFLVGKVWGMALEKTCYGYAAI